MGPDKKGQRGGGRGEPEIPPEPSFIKAVSITMGILSTSILVVLIPILGAILALTLVPYIASALGTRYARPGERIPASLTAAIVWSTVETATIIMIASMVIQTPMGFVIDGIGTMVLVTIWVLNMTFTILGALHPWKDPFKDYHDG
jgi:hypothetical protein